MIELKYGKIGGFFVPGKYLKITVGYDLKVYRAYVLKNFIISNKLQVQFLLPLKI